MCTRGGYVNSILSQAVSSLRDNSRRVTSRRADSRCQLRCANNARVLFFYAVRPSRAIYDSGVHCFQSTRNKKEKKKKHSTGQNGSRPYNYAYTRNSPWGRFVRSRGFCLAIRQVLADYKCAHLRHLPVGSAP